MIGVLLSYATFWHILYYVRGIAAKVLKTVGAIRAHIVYILCTRTVPIHNTNFPLATVMYHYYVHTPFPRWADERTSSKSEAAVCTPAGPICVTRNVVAGDRHPVCGSWRVRSENDFQKRLLPPLASNHFYRSLDRLQRSLAKHCGDGSKVGAIPKLDSQGTPERKGGRVLNKPCSSQKQPPPSHTHGLYLAATI